MSNNISIIGLGEIGTSLAMAFKEQNDPFIVTGCDLMKSAERRAEEFKCVDKIEHNLFSAAEDADVIILAIPADQTRKVLELIGHDIKPEAFILDFSPNKNAAAGWARQFMEHPARFLGIWAGINPEYLNEAHNGGKNAHPDLFKGGTLFAAADVKTDEQTIKLLIGLADMLGMECSFTEPLELDSMIAAGWQLPHLASHALLRCLTERPCWNDGKKAAEKTFCRMTSPAGEPMDGEEAGQALMNNREHMVRLLNEYMTVLKSFRDAIQNKDESALRGLLQENEKALEQWLAEYRRTNLSAGNPSPAPIPGISEGFTQTFFGGLLRKKTKN